MNIKSILVILAVSLCAATTPLAAAACTIKDDLIDAKHSKSGCPKDVEALFSRAFNCQHWGGEEPYDKERAAEISKAVATLKCNSMQKDYVTLRKKYADDAGLSKAMTKANEDYGFEFLYPKP